MSKNKKTKDPGSRAVLYARVSTEEQAGKDHFSIDAQFNEMREFAKEKGWEVVGEFVDEGISGTKRDRPQLNQVIKIAEKKGCDVIVAHDLSRLSRSVYHTLDIFDRLGKYQVGFASVKEPEFDFTDPSKRFFLTIITAINEYYIHILRAHTQKSKRERSRQGLYNASIMPLGYNHSGDSKKPARINEEESAIIRLIYESYAAGRFSDQDIADLLNKRQFKTRNKRRFSKDAITQILVNPFYMGKITYTIDDGRIEVHKGQHEAIISEDLWEKCQGVRASRRSKSRAVQKKFRNYLFSQLAVCDVCGRTLRAQGATSGSYYREMSYERGYADCPHQKTGVRSEILDRQAHKLIKNIQLPEDWLAEIAEKAGDDEEIIQLKRQRDSLEAQRRRVIQMRVEGEYDDCMDLYNEEMDRIRRESIGLPSYDQLETLKITASTIGQLYDIWDGAEPSDQSDLLRLMLREVRVDVSNGRITSIAPLGVFVPIFRNVPSLHEYEFGTFIPLWHDLENTAVINLSDLQPVKEDYTSTLPFFDQTPLLPPADARNTPGIAEALRMVSAQEDIYVLQIVSQERSPFPMDFRKWKSAAGEIAIYDMLEIQSPASVDVMVSQFALWDHGYSDTLKTISEKLKPGGVWYFQEFLPVDLPGHWLYQALPAAWEWAKKNTLSMYSLYNLAITEFESVKLKRHVFRQTVPHSTAQSLLKEDLPILRGIDQEAVVSAQKRLKAIIAEQSPLVSEFTIIEGWAKKV